MEEGTLERWIAPDGAVVSPGDPLFEMSTEKISSEIEAEAAGILRHLVVEGATVPAGAVVAVILAPGEQLPPEYAAMREALETGAPAPSPASAGGLPPLTAAAPAGPSAAAFVPASPLARRLAEEHGIDLSTLSGSGPGGRIVKEDVEAAIAARATQPPTPPAAAVIPLRGMRRTIAERMTSSLHQSAQLTITTEADVTETERMCHDLSREWRTQRVILSVTHAAIKAAALALRDHPRLNAAAADDEIRLNEYIHVGLAVALEEGLLVPVIRDADRRPLQEIAREAEALSERARAGGLSPDDVAGGTFTITSLGLYDIDAFTPIVNPGQTAILGLGRTRDAAAFEGERVVRRSVMTLSLTFDHRVVDGVPAAQFLRRVRHLLERPWLLLA